MILVLLLLGLVVKEKDRSETGIKQPAEWITSIFDVEHSKKNESFNFIVTTVNLFSEYLNLF